MFALAVRPVQLNLEIQETIESQKGTMNSELLKIVEINWHMEVKKRIYSLSQVFEILCVGPCPGEEGVKSRCA